jgi:hypothetical protein
MKDGLPGAPSSKHGAADVVRGSDRATVVAEEDTRADRPAK